MKLDLIIGIFVILAIVIVSFKVADERLVGDWKRKRFSREYWIEMLEHFPIVALISVCAIVIAILSSALVLILITGLHTLINVLW